MKKILIIVISLFFIVGCDNYTNTPSKETENYISKYQNLDKEVLKDLDEFVNTKNEFNSKQKEEYKSLLIKQYQNLSYKIVDERVENKVAIVDIEIEVYDYKSSIDKAKKYYTNHKEELMNKEEYNNYIIDSLKKVNDKVIYKLTLDFTRDRENNWIIENITDEDLEKIHGLF